MKKTKELKKLLAVVFAGAIAVTALQAAVNQAHLRFIIKRQFNIG